MLEFPFPTKGLPAAQPARASGGCLPARGRRITGEPAAWSRNLAWVGGGTALLVSLPFSSVGFFPVAPPGFALAAALLGAVSGRAVGRVAPGVLDRVRGRVSLWGLALLAPGVGGLWGAVVGGTAGMVVDGVDAALLGVLAGASVGSVQVGLSWFPLVFQTVRGRPVWPVVLASVALSPLLLPVALLGTTTVLGLLTPLSL